MDGAMENMAGSTENMDEATGNMDEATDNTEERLCGQMKVFFIKFILWGFVVPHLKMMGSCSIGY